MLERTAASLEPCSLQRVLPSAKQPLKNRRQLRSGFWQHGAADVELFDACQTLLRAPFLDLPHLPTLLPAPPSRTQSEIKLSSMNASAFLLDFLYPQGTPNVLRRLTPGGLDRREQPTKRYSSLSPRVQVTPISSSARLDRPPFTSENGSGRAVLERRHEPSSWNEDDAAFYKAFEDPSPRQPVACDPEALRQLLKEKDPGDKYHRIWSLYNGLEEDLEIKFRTRVMLKLSKSTGPSEAWKVAALFSRYRPEDWTEEIVRAAIIADLATDNVDRAVSTFRKALEGSGLVRGFDALLAHFLRTSNWDMVLQSWEAISTHVGYFPKGQEDEPGLHGPANTILAEAVPVETSPKSPGSTTVGSSYHKDVRGIAEHGTPEDRVPVDDPAANGRGKLSRGEPTAQDAPPDRSGSSWSIVFESTAELNGLAGKLLELYAFAESGAGRAKGTSKDVDRLVSLMRRNSLPLFQPNDAIFLVERIGDPLKGYPRLVFTFLRRREKKQAAEIYRKYRQLPNSTVIMRMLPPMLDTFSPDDITGVEQVRHDWKQIGDEGMNRRAYSQFLSFYARHGDVRSLYDFWAEHHDRFESRQTKDAIESREMAVERFLTEDPATLARFLRAHAMHGDVNEVHNLLDRALKTSGRGPTTTEGNILLQAHARNGDYDGALRVFTKICEIGEPNTHTFVLLMQLASSLGDLEFCLDLSRLAEDYNLQPTPSMVDTLVEAYCQNERYIEAERLCIRSTEQGRFDKKATMLWNTLLRHHGCRRDLTTVTRLLNTMSTYKLPYNNETYDHLLNALVHCNQAHHAMHLLRVAETEGIFEPTLHQYLLLMTAFIRTGEPHMVIRVHETMMQTKHFPDSAKRMTKVIEAYGKWFQMPRNQFAGKSGQWFVNRALGTFKKSLGREDRTAVDDSRSVNQQYSKMVSVLVEARDFGSAQEVIELYRSQFTKGANDEELPIHLLSSMMLADYYERKFWRAKKTWELIVTKLTEHGRPARSRFDVQLEGAGKHQPALAPSPVVAAPQRPSFGAENPRVSIPKNSLVDSNDPVSSTLLAMRMVERDPAGELDFAHRPATTEDSVHSTKGRSAREAEGQAVEQRETDPAPSPEIEQLGSLGSGAASTEVLSSQQQGSDLSPARDPGPSPETTPPARGWSPNRTPRLLPGLRYAINEPLKTMQRILVVEQDPNGLESLIKRLQKAGFLIDSANWNYYVQAQARLKRWKEAFKTCEAKLMPRWGGWYRVRQSRGNKHQLSLEARRLGSSPRHLRPIAHTLFVLAKEYLDLEKMTPWSGQAAEVFQMLKDECPKVVEAVTSLIRDPESQLENDIFAGLWEPEMRDLAGDIEARRPFSDDVVAQELAAQRDTRNRTAAAGAEERRETSNPSTEAPMAE